MTRLKSVPAPLRAKPLPWRMIEHGRNAHELRFDVHGGWEQYVLLQSDVHFDHTSCDRALYFRHLREAQERHAPVLCAGDLLCAMQGRKDKRSSKSELRGEHKKSNYLDELVDDTARQHLPYAQNLALIGYGNHETGILKHCETDLIQRFAQSLHDRAPSTPLRVGGYSGFVRFTFRRGDRWGSSQVLFYTHGTGGGGPVTRDVIQSNRRAAIFDADIIWSGHTHDQWILPVMRLGLSQSNRVQQRRQLHVKSPGYKNEFADGFGGFAVEKGHNPKPLGAIWLRFSYVDDVVHCTATLAE